MSTILFVNACMRGNDSRTLSLCKEYLATKTSDDIEEVNLDKLALSPLSGSSAAYRMEKQAEKAWEDPIFTYAKQMAEADEIVIGAPYWDLSFPYTQEGRPEGLCKSKTLTYITTSGGFIGDKNFGYDYVLGLAEMLSLGNPRFISVEGLDIIGMDIDAQIDKARQAIKELI